MRTKLRDGEVLVLECRRHWVTLAKVTAVCVLAFVLWAAVIVWAHAGGMLLLVMVGLLLVPSGVMGYRMYDRYCDLWAVTNQRVIDEEGVFTTTAKESPLEKINNVSTRQTLVGRALGYGDVTIQTAAEMGATTYTFVTAPELLKDTIMRCQLECRRAPGEGADGPAEAAGNAGTKVCPFCAETIRALAKVCRFCGRDV